MFNYIFFLNNNINLKIYKLVLSIKPYKYLILKNKLNLFLVFIFIIFI